MNSTEIMEEAAAFLRRMEADKGSTESLVPTANKKEITMTSTTGAWAADKDGDFHVVDKAEQSLPSGVYSCFEAGNGIRYFRRVVFPSDDTISLPGLPSDYILNQIKYFWGKKDTYNKYGFLHKRGILMYGPPGCGKTSIIRLLVDEFVKQHNGIVVTLSNFTSQPLCLSSLRNIEPNRPVMTLMEDIEGIFDGDGGPTQVQAALSFLDGQFQLNNVVHIATTNKPELLADRFIKRPGRFDLVIGIHAPLAETREAYLRHVSSDKISELDIKKLVAGTEGLGLSYLRELASTYLCLEIPLEETLERLQANFKAKVLSNNAKPKMGFTIGYQPSEAA